MKHWIGIDTGGTSIRIHVFDASGTSISNYSFRRNQLGNESGTDFTLLLKALENAHIHPDSSRFEGIAAGWTGYARREDQARFEEQLGKTFPGLSIGIFSDAAAAHASVFGNSDGLLSIHGTGSLQLLRQNGIFIRKNGFGFMLGDVAGGVSIGRNGVRKALSQRDGGMETSINIAFNRFLNNEPLLDWIIRTKTSPEFIAAFAPSVLELASSGDPDSEKIVNAELDLLSMILRGFSASGKIPFQVHGGLTTDQWFHKKLCDRFFSVGFSHADREVNPAKGAVFLLQNR